MKQLLVTVFLPLILFINHATAFADQTTHAKMYAVEWVAKVNSVTTDKDIVSIVETAFEHGIKHNIDPLLILSLISVESTFNKKARNKSTASGLMQVVPKWHRDKIKGRNIYTISVNLEVGSNILKNCLEKNSQKLNAAMECYSGGAGKPYLKKVSQTYKSLRRWVIENQFEQQLPIYYVSAPYSNLTF